MTETLTTIYHVAEIVIAIGFLAGVFVLTTRGKAKNAIAVEWKELATAKAAKITDLETRVSHLESELRAVRSENDEYRRLNLEYQAEVVELRRKVVELEREVQRHGR
ncbi:MAG TPA: hypothetical protein VN736_00480 [Candidatus Limnocylindrales bacterium]|nr:hypothetical protein [Candidatus Limnocylindrales bacterium]